MEEVIPALVIIGILLIIVLYVFFSTHIQNYKNMKSERAEVENKRREYETKYAGLELTFEQRYLTLSKEFDKKKKAVQIQEKELQKKEKKLEQLREETKYEVKILKEEIKSLKRHIKYLTQFYPIIEDEADTEDIEIEYKSEYLTKEEYLELSDTERNELAYERYKKRKKSKWEIGRDFEMYIGYMARTSGYKVEYSGIENKLKDLGRDLIVSNNNEEFIIQCKYWSKNKIIHEKHLCQIYGTTIMYNIQNNKNAIPTFISHCALSDTAKEFAKKLNIYVLENIELKDFPAIKCNLKDKIYHLPFDQQYDTFKDKNCYYAWTVEEAEEKGCRRAYKWHGENNIL